jgi:predicted site-specific integrase-resolvase
MGQGFSTSDFGNPNGSVSKRFQLCYLLAYLCHRLPVEVEGPNTDFSSMVKSFHLLPQILTKYHHLLQNPSKNCILRYMKLSSYAKHIGIHYNTAWRMWKRGQIDGYQLPTGTVIINPPVEQMVAAPPKQQIVAIYARVSSSENKTNLETQAERLISWCNAQGWSVGKVVKECGSGINDQRPKFLALLANPHISRIVVEHKERASRFGVAYIQTLLAMQERELVVVNTADTVEDDLMGDFVAIITSFAARLYGRRRAKRKTALVLAALQQNGTTHEPQTRES